MSIKYASITSVDVEKSFSMCYYKNIVIPNSQRFQVGTEDVYYVVVNFSNALF